MITLKSKTDWQIPKGTSLAVIKKFKSTFHLHRQLFRFQVLDDHPDQWVKDKNAEYLQSERWLCAMEISPSPIFGTDP